MLKEDKRKMGKEQAIESKQIPRKLNDIKRKRGKEDSIKVIELARK